mmetsp:Transcript_59370/g.193693  ORF Transcript_59370/g.193693 Transcript_59370/m.193693 type:complete len:238 (+) Transcript_59370:2385-3098(+)
MGRQQVPPALQIEYMRKARQHHVQRQLDELSPSARNEAAEDGVGTSLDHLPEADAARGVHGQTCEAREQRDGDERRRRRLQAVDAGEEGPKDGHDCVRECANTVGHFRQASQCHIRDRRGEQTHSDALRTERRSSLWKEHRAHRHRVGRAHECGNQSNSKLARHGATITGLGQLRQTRRHTGATLDVLLRQLRHACRHHELEGRGGDEVPLGVVRHFHIRVNFDAQGLSFDVDAEAV